MLYHGFLPQGKPTHAANGMNPVHMVQSLPLSMKDAAQAAAHQQQAVAVAAAHEPASSSSGSHGGPGFLYNLLTSADARSIQRQSAFFTEPVVPVSHGTTAAEEFPRRSNSLTLRRCHLSIPAEHLEPRPSSVPHHPRRHHPYASASSPHSLSPAPSTLSTSSSSAASTPAVQHPHQQQNSSRSGSGSVPGSEPLDLCVRADCSDSESVSSSSTEHSSATNMVQPLLRNILQRGAGGASSTPAAPPAPANNSEEELVQLSRKQAHVVRARVTQWLKEAVDFAVEKPVFQSLSTDNQVALLKRAWPRLLLLSMAEGGCHFAVSTCDYSADNNSSRPGQRHPTRAFADSLLRVIQLGHNLGLDETAFNLLRLAAIFKSDSDAEVSLSQVHAEILAYLHSHMKQNERAEFFPNVVRLLAVLSDVDRDQMESLLCSQLPDSSVETFLQERVISLASSTASA